MIGITRSFLSEMRLYMKHQIQLGKYQELIVTKKTNFGVYLNTPTGEDFEKILLPKSQVPEGTQINDVLNVFVYKDSEDRPIATMLEPDLTLGGVARLYVKQVTPIGAFLEWGLSKDLLLPYKEQLYEVKEGDAVLVTLYLDKSERLCASMHVYEALRNDSDYQKDDQVSGRVYEISDNFGVFVAVDDMYSALIPKKDVFEAYRINQPVNARVAQIMDDGRLTLSVKKKIPEQMNDDAEFIFRCLENEGGFLPFHDKSTPEAIKNRFHMSKNAFKRGIGRLMKEGKIIIAEDGIRKL
jgi:predicted RNA-binding protein (virulence factor B family)